LSHGTPIESWHTNWVMAHQFSHVTPIESCHTNWVMSHQLSHVTPIESCHTCLAHSCLRRADLCCCLACSWCSVLCRIVLAVSSWCCSSSRRVCGSSACQHSLTWLIHVWHDSFACDVTISSWCCSSSRRVCGSLACQHSYVTWLIHVWHDSFMRDMTHSHVTWRFQVDATLALGGSVGHERVSNNLWHDSCTCDMPHSYVKWFIHMYIHMLQTTFIRDILHSHVTWQSQFGAALVLGVSQSSTCQHSLIRNMSRSWRF